MVMSRHEFLAALHKLLDPMMYLEIGVQTGVSLRLATEAQYAIGVDPYPVVDTIPHNAAVVTDTSDHFFAYSADWMLPLNVDLAFIDGDHRWEYACRDFLNIETHLVRRVGVVVFDDVLPYNIEMASREMIPGDWTGDAWKVYYWLLAHRPDIQMRLVDTSPTGTLVCWNLAPDLAQGPVELADADTFLAGAEPPQEILTRSIAVSAEEVLQELADWWPGR